MKEMLREVLGVAAIAFIESFAILCGLWLFMQIGEVSFKQNGNLMSILLFICFIVCANIVSLIEDKLEQ